MQKKHRSRKANDPRNISKKSRKFFAHAKQPSLFLKFANHTSLGGRRGGLVYAPSAGLWSRVAVARKPLVISNASGSSSSNDASQEFRRTLPRAAGGACASAGRSCTSPGGSGGATSMRGTSAGGDAARARRRSLAASRSRNTLASSDGLGVARGGGPGYAVGPDDRSTSE